MKGGPKSFLHQALRLFIIVFVHNCNFVRKEHISFYLKINSVHNYLQSLYMSFMARSLKIVYYTMKSP